MDLGFANNAIQIDRSCGVPNTSVHQCIGLRKENTRLQIHRNGIFQDTQFANVSFVCGKISDCIGKYSADTEIWDIFCKQVLLFIQLRKITFDTFLHYRNHCMCDVLDKTQNTKH